MVENGRWNRDRLPGWIKRLDTYEAEDAHHRFRVLCKVEMKPTRPRKNFPWREFFTPMKGMQARAIPEGILPLSAEDGFDHDIKLERFFNKYSPRGIVVWGYEMEYQGSFAGPYNAAMRSWIATHIFSEFICVIAQDADIALVTNQVYAYSVTFAPAEFIDELDKIFGGKESLEAEFRRHIDEGDMPFDEEDDEWARKYLLPMNAPDKFQK